MHRTGRRSWLKVCAVGLLILPAFGASEVPDMWPVAIYSVPFLVAVGTHNHALQTLAFNATVPAILLTSPLPAAVDPKPSAPQGAFRPIVRGTAASLVTQAATAMPDEALVIVQQGQTLWSIAQRHGVTVEVLAAANGLGEDEIIQVGQPLVIPGGAVGPTWAVLPTGTRALPPPARVAKPFTARVREGETLWEIAQAYGISVDSIVDANGLGDGDPIRTGQQLIIPGSAGDVLRRVVSTRGLAASIAQSFVWPARGPLSSRFGWRVHGHHNGIDIAAPRGSPIHVARAGQVVFAGWYFGYGLAVIVDHGDGVSTIYGHASKLLVPIGEVVAAGQVIALVGSTGASTGPHLHFELRVNGRPLNPMHYL
jgi:murein DD-endopeptidase MepM/ murein hydrolase activator NlpD